MKMMVRCLAALLLVAGMTAVYATPITGNVSLGGYDVGVQGPSNPGGTEGQMSGLIDWFKTNGVSGTPSFPGQLFGLLSVTSGTGTFLASAPTGAQIKDLTNNSDTGAGNPYATLAAAGQVAVAGVMTSEPTPEVSKFITFTGGGAPGPIYFDLTTLLTGASFAAPPAPVCTGSGDVYCVPFAGSPFVLQNNAGGGVTIKMKMFLAGYTGTAASGYTFYEGDYSTVLSSLTTTADPGNSTPATIDGLLGLIAAGDEIQTPVNASFTLSSVPEPGTAFLAISGLLLGAGLVRRRRNRA